MSARRLRSDLCSRNNASRRAMTDHLVSKGAASLCRVGPSAPPPQIRPIVRYPARSIRLSESLALYSVPKEEKESEDHISTYIKQSLCRYPALMSFSSVRRKSLGRESLRL